MLLQPLADSGYVSLAVLFVYREYQVVWSACLSICVPCASVLRAYMWRPQGSGMGFIIEYYHQHCICETQNNKTQVPCCLLPFGWGSRGTGFIMEYAIVCGGSAGELCLSCAAPKPVS